MKKKIKYILILITFCTMALISLQVYWNFMAYKQSGKSFKSDINNALKEAITLEQELKRSAILEDYKKWLADTNIILITAKWNEQYQRTYFTISDKYPPKNEQREPFTLGLRLFTKKINEINAKDKAFFIQHFVDDIVSKELRQGDIYFYTKRLGDLADSVHERQNVFPEQLKSLYTKELISYGIQSTFLIDTGNNQSALSSQFPYSTKSFEIGRRKPFIKVAARFMNPNIIIFQRMKWTLIGSFLLIVITIFCFAYTVKTILSQKKMAEIKDSFVKNMAHELRTPVATISIAAEAIEELALSKISTDEYVSIIRYQSKNMSYMIEEILDSLVKEQVEFVLNYDLVSLTDIITNCINQFRPQLEAAGAVLNFNNHNVLSHILGDRVHLGNVIVNLIDNAIKYGGEKPKIVIQISEKNKKAIFEISNEGDPIPREYHEKIFERFFRVPTENIHNVKGYGLGLNYVKNITNRHNGSIDIKSNSSSTTFILQFPLAKNEIS